MGSRKQSSNQLAKQANLKRVASQILETMSCDESMESSQDNKDKRNNNNNNMTNNTGKETTSKNAMKRPRKSPTKTKLGKSVRGPSRGPSQDREDSGACRALLSLARSHHLHARTSCTVHAPTHADTYAHTYECACRHAGMQACMCM